MFDAYLADLLAQNKVGQKVTKRRCKYFPIYSTSCNIKFSIGKQTYMSAETLATAHKQVLKYLGSAKAKLSSSWSR